MKFDAFTSADIYYIQSTDLLIDMLSNFEG